MRNQTEDGCIAKRGLCTTRFLLAATVLLISAPAYAQQDYVGRFDVYAGYMFLDSPHIKLFENGFHTQVGYRATNWLSLGFDYIYGTGSTTITPNLLTTGLQQELGAELGQLMQEGIIPTSYTLAVPINSKTETYSAGPQVSYRHFKAVTLFIRPDLGAMHETARPVPTADPVAQGIINQLAPGGVKTDWVAFYGFGGGVDLNITPHFSLRIQADLVHDHLFNDLLKDSRNTVRFAIGPGFQWGKNVAK
jgi:Outer membrane protein beta-barrel domain